MNEAELAERFNKELDALLQGGEEGCFSPDAGALELAAAFARADFSGESAIKETLRTRLAGEDLSGGFARTLRALLCSGYARAALAAACVLLVLVPLTRRSAPPVTAPVTVPAPVPAPANVLPEFLPPLPAIPAARHAAAARAAVTEASGMFQPIPMARLEGEPIRDFPIGPAGGGSPIVSAGAREVRVENGSDIVLETEHAVFKYERRVTSPEEIFERRAL